MIAGFLSALQVEDDDGFPFTLLQPLIYDSAILDARIVVPTGFQTDYASIPRILWNVLSPVGRYDRAAVIHDLLYQRGTIGARRIERGEADRVLREAMDLLKVPHWQRWAIYIGVRLGGWVTWNRYRAKEPASV